MHAVIRIAILSLVILVQPAQTQNTASLSVSTADIPPGIDRWTSRTMDEAIGMSLSGQREGPAVERFTANAWTQYQSDIHSFVRTARGGGIQLGDAELDGTVEAKQAESGIVYSVPLRVEAIAPKQPAGTEPMEQRLTVDVRLVDRRRTTGTLEIVGVSFE